MAAATDISQADDLQLTGKDNTPAMRQFHRFKRQYPQCVLFFRMGDFYELFHDDAKLAHKVLGVTLTQRTAGIPMAGVPYHAVEGYLRRMIQAGYRVAVCDQVEDPREAKGVVERDVTRVVTPGTLTDDSLLEEGRENPLAAVMFHGEGQGSAQISNLKSEIASLAWAELSTGSFHVATMDVRELADEVARVGPRELLYVETANGEVPKRVKVLAEAAGCSPAARPAWQFRQNEAVETLQRQFQVRTLDGFGLGADDPVLGVASAVVHYLLETQKTGRDGAEPRIAHLQPPRRFCRTDHLVIDHVSLRSLEVERTMRTGDVAGSLLGNLQDCRTAMGKRTLRQWLCFPLRERGAIEARQRIVAAMIEDSRFLDELRTLLDDVQDVQRMSARISVGRAAPRDLVALGGSASQCAVLKELIADRPAVASYHAQLSEVSPPLVGLAQRITAACIDSPPHHLREGGLIRDGYDAQLDECRALQRDSNDWLARYQKQLIDGTGIANLKVGFNKIFGFYIELTASQRDRAPTNWTRKQTLKNAERFITPELKEYEGKVLTAEQRAIAREQDLFAQLCTEAQRHMNALQTFAQVAAELDVLACFARRAVRRRYVCPRIVDEPVLHVRAGRHPVLDELLGDRFVSNDMMLGTDQSSTLALITGPNMAGKSTYIRQAAIITLLAHTGSFVPAEEATVGLCDRIFTRIGASDELHTGQSTFMVEMTETANICHHATPASLVILDEIGRGTSTLDGLALAWAIAEHLAERGCRSLFATHYHELTALSERHANVANLHVTVREWQDEIVFLYRIVPGATDRSYGIHVAKIAGLPPSVLDRASALLEQLEVNHTASTPLAASRNPPDESPPTSRTKPRPAKPEPQLSLFTEYVHHPALDELRNISLDAMTPIQAFDYLRKLRDTLAKSQQ